MTSSLLKLKNQKIYISSNKEIEENLYKKFRNNKPSELLLIQNFIDENFLKKIERNIKETIKVESRAAMYRRGSIPAQEFSDQNLLKLWNFLNGPIFLEFIEKITGINGLIPDPYCIGAGIHITKTKGKLGLHKDFNFHEKMKLKRVLNLLLYINSDWKNDYNGNFELYSSDFKSKQAIEPILNNCVLFRTDRNTYHGFPDSLKCPSSKTRKALAIYYYVNPIETLNQKKIDTYFTARKNSSDNIEIINRIKMTIKDFTPPILSRGITKLKNILNK